MGTSQTGLPTENWLGPPEFLLRYHNLAYGPKSEQYGDPCKTYGRVARAASVLLGQHLTTKDILFIMILVKLSREVYKHGEDNLGDAAAFLAFLNDWEEAAEKGDIR